MKVLIVDDQAEKAEKLADLIRFNSPDVELSYASNAHDGFLAINSQKVDLVLLDVVLPMGFGDSPSEDGSLWFVKEVHRRLDCPNQPFIVGTTQYAESLAKVQEVFRDYLWNIIHVNDLDERWPRQLQQAVRFAQSNAHRLSMNRSNVGDGFDVAVVSALRTPEFSELVDALGGGDPIRLGETNETWIRCKILRGDGKEISVVAACADDMGMTAMASLVTRISIVCAPKVLILSGILAGNSKRVSLSDMIIVESTWDCRAGKLTEKGFSPDVRSRECSYRLANRFISILDEDFVIEFWRKWRGDRPQNIAKLHKGDVACSPAVVSDGNTFEELELQKRKILGLEMEAYGCYDAARRLGDLAPEVICLKSVCDFGDGEKNDQYQQYCAGLAAASIVHVIKDIRFTDGL